MTTLNSSGESEHEIDTSRRNDTSAERPTTPLSQKKDKFQLFDQIVARNKKVKISTDEELTRMKKLADQITFEILADTVAKDIALMLK